MILTGLLLSMVVGWFILRRRRAGVLAGRDVERPTYHVEPPGRRVGRMRDGRL